MKGVFCLFEMQNYKKKSEQPNPIEFFLGRRIGGTFPQNAK